MGVIEQEFAKLSKDDISQLLEASNLGRVKHIKSLSKGTDASTYTIFTPKQSYVLTLFEEKQKNIPYQIKMSNYLIDKGFPLAKILASSHIMDKDALISSYLSGKVKSSWTLTDYETIGFFIGNLHKATSSFPMQSSSTPFIWELSKLFFSLQSKIPIEFQRLEQTIYFLEENWPHDLPKGIIHGDLWHKNILFENDQISGILDFKALYDPFILDIANVIKGIHNKDPIVKKALLSGYEVVRPLSNYEKECLNFLVYAKIVSTILYLLKKSIIYPNRKDEFQTYAFLGLLKLDSLECA